MNLRLTRGSALAGVLVLLALATLASWQPLPGIWAEDRVATPARLVVFESFLHGTCPHCEAAAPVIDDLADEYAGQAVVFLEQDPWAPNIGARYDRCYEAAKPNPAMPLAMVGSGYRYSSGAQADYAAKFRSMVDADLVRPAKADVSGTAHRIGDKVRVSATVKNLSGVNLGAANGATVHAMVYVNEKLGLTNRFVLAAPHAPITSPLNDGESDTFTLVTDDLEPADWSKVRVVIAVDYRPGGVTGAYDMLQAVEVGVRPPRVFVPFVARGW